MINHGSKRTVVGAHYRHASGADGIDANNDKCRPFFQGCRVVQPLRDSLENLKQGRSRSLRSRRSVQAELPWVLLQCQSDWHMEPAWNSRQRA